MKILFLTNNSITKPLYNWLCETKNYDVLLFFDRINLKFLEKINPDLIISYNYKHIIEEGVIQTYNNIINLHPSLLPWNRGASPNFWSFIKDTPKGITIHLIDKGIDTGNILLQKEIFFDENLETLETSYKKLHIEIQKLFIENWENLKHFNINPVKQQGYSTFHKRREFEKIKFIIGDNIYKIPIIELKQISRKIIDDYNR